MKKVLVLIGVVALSATVAFASVGKAEKVEMKVDTKASKVHWTGKKVTGEHTGHLSIKEGSVWVADGSIAKAAIHMDMNSIVCTDLEGEWNEKLVGHLKSDDFFSVENHPRATFEAKSFEKSGDGHKVTGDLMIKGITHEISFPVEVSMSGNTVTANGSATIDRTKWDIKYGSGKFFSDLGDRMIDDNFTITFELVAKSNEALTAR